MDYDYADVGDIPMIAPVRRVDADAVDAIPPPPPSLPPPDSLPASPEKEPHPPPPPPPGSPPNEHDDDGPPSLTPEPSPSRAAARFAGRYDDDGDDDRGMGGGPVLPTRSSKFAGTGAFASSAGRGGKTSSAASNSVPSSPPPPPPPPPVDEDDSCYEDVGDIPMMSHRLPPPPPPPPDAVGGPSLPAPGAAGAVLADVNDDTGVPVGPVAASPAVASLARGGVGGVGGDDGDDDDYYDDEGDAGKGRKRHIPTGTVKGIGKRLFGKGKKDGVYDEEEEGADEFEGDDRAEEGGGRGGRGEAAMDFNPILRPPLAPSSTQASEGGPGTAVPSPPPSPPPSCRNLDDDIEMEGMSSMEEGSGGGVEVAVPDDELLLRGAEDLKRQSDAVLSPKDEEKDEEQEGGVNANAGADAGADKSLMPAVVFNDMETLEGDSSLSHSAMMENEPPKLKPETEQPPPPTTKDKATKTADALATPDEDESKDEAVARSMTEAGDSTGDMMSDILGVTMPGDETTIGELEDTAAKLAAVAIKVDDTASPGATPASPAANLDGEDQEEEENNSEVVESGKGVVGAGLGSSLEKTKDSMTIEEDRFNDIPPASPDQVVPHAGEPKGYDVAAKLAEAVYGQTVDTAEHEIEVDDQEAHKGFTDMPVDRATASGGDVDRDDIGPTEVPAEDDKPIDTLSTLRRADEALKAAGLITGSTSNADAASDDEIPKDEEKGTVTEVATAAVATATATAAAGGVVSSAVEASSSEGALDYSMNETPEVSMADDDLEGVRLSAIDDQVSPIKKEPRSGGDDSRASSGSALNLDITGPGGDGAWDTPEKTVQEKTEAAVVAASKTRSRAADAEVEDPPAISLSLTDESLDDKRLGAADAPDAKVKDEEVAAKAKMQEPPGSPLSTSKKKKPVWRAVVEEASGDIYYYNRKTRETTWDKPEGVEIDDKRRLFNESFNTSSGAAASSVVDGGDGGTLTKTSDVAHDDSPQVGSQIQRQGQEQQRELREKVEKEDNDEEGKRETGGKWKAVVDKSSGETYYYHTATNETTWDRPASYAEKKGMVKRGRKAAHSIGGLLGRSMKHVIGGTKGASHEEEEEAASTAQDVAGTNEDDGNGQVPRNDETGRVAVVKDAETREAEAKKRGKALKFLKMKSVKHSTSENKGAVSAASIEAQDDDEMKTAAKKKSLRLGFGKKKGGAESVTEPIEQVGPPTPSQAHEDVSSDAGMDGYSGMETSGDDDHGHGRGPDFSIAAMDTPDKVQLPTSAMKSRFQPSLRSSAEKDEIIVSEDQSAAEAEGGGNDSTPQDKDLTSSKADSNGTGRKDDPNKLWRAIVDAKTLNTYYYNVRTKETSWEKPNGFIDVSRDELSASLE